MPYSHIHVVQFESSSHNCFSADDSSSDDSASSDASEFCPSHEDETSDKSAELLTTEESEFGCQDNPDCFLLLLGALGGYSSFSMFSTMRW